jgi:uncharacterized protein YgiM (DUF1202 family)
MKRNNIIRAFSVVCCGVMLFGYCLDHEETTVSLAANSTAGVSADMSADVEGDSEAYALLTSSSDVVATGTGDGTVYGYTNVGIVQVDGNLNIRKEANENGEIIGKIKNGGAVEVLDTVDGWVHVSSGKVEGYVSADYVVTGQEAVALANEYVSWVATVTGDGLRIRQEPNTESPVIINVSSGEKLDVVEDMGDWIKVAIDGDEGYVSAEYVTTAWELEHAMTLEEINFGAGVNGTRASLCQFAIQFVGNPYVWGGTSLTKGADCSGFVLSVFANYGIYLPHSSRAQANCGTKISASEAQPGDLFFYGSGSISHVAIYIGNGQIVHASNRRTGIKISSAYYRNPLKVVRILN